MSDLDCIEFQALREAITARSHLRATLFVVGLAVWAAVLVACLIALPYPLVSVLPLTLLLGTFEAIRPLHFGAERIGRYLQVFYEEEPAANPSPHFRPAWERTAMAFGPGVPGAAGHPLYLPVFLIATVANGLGVLLPGPIRAEIVLLAVPHVAFVIWMLVVDRSMRSQRARELAPFRELRDRAAGRP